MRVSAQTMASYHSTAARVARRAAGAVSLLAVAGLLVACGGLVKKTPEACTVTIAPRDVTVPVNGSQTVIGTAFDCDGNSIPKRIPTFSSSNSAVASVTTTGNIIGLSVGTAKISAVANGKTGDANVTVTPERVATTTVTPASITLRKTNVKDFVAVAKNSQGTVIPGISFQWASSNSSIAFVDNNGKVTALAVGFANITATADGQSSSSAVTVTEVPIGSCTLTPATQKFLVTEQRALTLALKDTAGNTLSSTGRTLSYASDNDIVATVSGTGIVTGRKAGTAKITATNPDNTSVSCPANVEIADPKIKTVNIQPVNQNLRLGAPRQFTVTLLDSNGVTIPQAGRVVSWRNVTPAIATVSPAGLVTGIALGSGRVAVDAEGVVDTASFQISKIPVATVSLSPLQRQVTELLTAQFTPTVTDSAGNIVTDRVIDWRTSDITKGTVNSTGLVTTLGAGTITVTANSEGKEGSATLIITQAPVDTIQVVANTFTLAKNTNSQFAITLRDAAGNQLRNRNVTVTSDQPSFAVGVANAAATLVTVTGVGVGSATLTIQAVNSNNQNEGKATKVVVTVTAAVPIVSPPSSAIKRE